jgi:hypothetical protein
VKALAGEPGAYGGPDKPATFDVTSYYINPDVNWGFWSGAAAYDHLAPALGVPAPQLVVRTVRAVTATQASNGQPSCAGKFAGMACWDQHTAHTEHGSSIVGLLTAAALTVGGIGLTAINIAQAGADPGTDALEAADLGALTDNLTTDDETGVSESDNDTPIYRGVAQNHNAFADAQQGIASPGDETGETDVYAHNSGDTWTSRLTSWTTDPDVAEGFAGGKGGGGVVLQTTIEEMQARGVNILWSPNLFDEEEILLEGRIEGVQVTRP